MFLRNPCSSCVLRRLILVCTVCSCPFCGMLGINGLILLWIYLGCDRSSPDCFPLQRHTPTSGSCGAIHSISQTDIWSLIHQRFCLTLFSANLCRYLKLANKPLLSLKYNQKTLCALRKHTYSNILKTSPPNTENFQTKSFDIFHISAQNIDCGYSLEAPGGGGSNEYPQSMCLSWNKKIMYTPVNPSFTI